MSYYNINFEIKLQYFHHVLYNKLFTKIYFNIQQRQSHRTQIDESKYEYTSPRACFNNSF